MDQQKLIKNFNEEISNQKNDIKKRKNKNDEANKFRKNNDENYHINFLSFSNLTANNYNIEKTDFLNVKEIAGNIILAIDFLDCLLFLFSSFSFKKYSVKNLIFYLTIFTI